MKRIQSNRHWKITAAVGMLAVVLCSQLPPAAAQMLQETANSEVCSTFDFAHFESLTKTNSIEQVEARDLSREYYYVSSQNVLEVSETEIRYLDRAKARQFSPALDVDQSLRPFLPFWNESEFFFGVEGGNGFGWDVNSNAQTHLEGLASVESVERLNDGRIVGRIREGIVLWKPSGGQPYAKIAADGHYDFRARFSNDTSRVLTGSVRNREFFLWDTNSGEMIARLKGIGASFIGGGDEVAVLTRSGTVRMFDSMTGKEKAVQLPTHRNHGRFVSYDGDRYALFEPLEGPVTIYGPQGLIELPANTATGSGIGEETEFFPEIGVLKYTWKNATGSRAEFFDLMTGERVWDHTVYEYNNWKVIQSPSRDKVFVYSRTQVNGYLIDVKSGQLIFKTSIPELLGGGLSEDMSTAEFSGDGTKLLTLTGGGVVRIWDTASGSQIGPASPKLGDFSLIVREANGEFHSAVNRGKDEFDRRWDLSWSSWPLEELRVCGGIVLDEIERKKIAAANDERQQTAIEMENDREANAISARTAITEIDAIVDFSRKDPATCEAGPFDIGASLLLQEKSLPSDFAEKSVCYHPLDTYYYALTLFNAGDSELAVFWMYAGQFRFRTQLSCSNAKQAELAIFSVLSQNIGADINKWAGGDVPLWVVLMEKSRTWLEAIDDPFLRDPKCVAARAEQMEGFQELIDWTTENKDEIFRTRLEQGLSNRVSIQ